MKSKTIIWLFLISGLLWLLVGLRDIFAPGFFSPNGRVVTVSNIALDFSVATVFLTVAGYMASKIRHVNSNGK